MRWFVMFHSCVIGEEISERARSLLSGIKVTRWVQHGWADMRLDAIFIFTILAILAGLIAEYYPALWRGNW